MQQNPKITVVIPTRERASTLLATLQTCVAQDYDRLEIIVSDNFSGDQTGEVVHSFQDNRIRYVNPGRRLSMSENWEFALSHVSGGYVTVLGDDDGLLPDAVSDAASVISATGTGILSWLKAEYCWPNHIIAKYRNFLILPLLNQLIRFEARTALRDVKRLWLPYNRTPTLYNSFVDHDIIRRTRARDGGFFKSFAPDVYSGIVFLSAVESYLYSIRPFSLNGASAHSTGTSDYHPGADKGPVDKFLTELGSDPGYEFGRLNGSVHAVVAECLLQANKYCFNGSLGISKRLLIWRILSELARKGEAEYQRALPELHAIARRHGLANFAAVCAKLMTVRPPQTDVIRAGLDSRGFLTLDSTRFDVKDVYEAALVAAKVLGPYTIPQRIIGYTALNRLYSRVVRWVCNRPVDKSF